MSSLEEFKQLSTGGLAGAYMVFTCRSGYPAFLLASLELAAEVTGLIQSHGCLRAYSHKG